MPVPNMDTPPRSHASTIRSRSAPEAAAVDERRGAHDVDAGLEDAHELLDVGHIGL